MFCLYCLHPGNELVHRFLSVWEAEALMEAAGCRMFASC